MVKSQIVSGIIDDRFLLQVLVFGTTECDIHPAT